MDLSALGYRHRRDVVVLLGAGATRGSSFVENHHVWKPPLDADFFRQLRVTQLSRALSDEVTALLSFVEEEFGSLDIGMELFYSQAFLHDKFVGEIPTGKRGRLRRYEVNLGRFRRLLPLTLGSSLSNQHCNYHNELVRHASAADVFISFNYDCVLDLAMVNSGLRRWDPGAGYGIPIAGGTTYWQNHSGRGRFPMRGLTLLKPHGSLNWRRRGRQIHLRSNPYEERPDSEFAIVPPLWQKDFDADPYRAVWSKARRALASTKALIVIGYSLPDTDVYTQAMLRIDVDQLEFLCLVNPDARARRRTKSALRGAISSATYVLELDQLRDLAKLLQT